jgi:serine phosphatase RsbU (regulator of sigma subunit)
MRGNSYSLQYSKGTLVGMLHDREYEHKELTLYPGDRIYLYTDGIPETVNRRDEIIGFEHVPDLIKEISCDDLEATLDAVLNEVHAFRETMPLADDIVLIGIEVV